MPSSASPAPLCKTASENVAFRTFFTRYADRTPLKLAVLPALFALAVCQTTTAGTVSSASFQATLVVHEVCTVSIQRAAAQVHCRHNTPYQLHQQAAPSGAGLVTITF